MNHDMHRLHQSANDTLLGRLHSGLLGMCSGATDLGQTAETFTGWPHVSTDTAQAADAGTDCVGDQGEGVKA